MVETKGCFDRVALPKITDAVWEKVVENMVLAHGDDLEGMPSASDG